MTLAVQRRRSRQKPELENSSSRPTYSEEAKRSERRRELVLLGLVLLGIVVFFAGYATGQHDSTFRTSWYTPLRGTSAAPHTIGSVQGGRIDQDGNTPLLVTVRGLPVLPVNQRYVLYVLDGKRKPARCGSFAVGKGTTQVKLSYPGLPTKPRGWKMARETNGAIGIGEVVAETARR